MADRGESRSPAVGVLTVGWIVGLVAVLWWLWSLAWEGWADQVSGRTSPDLAARAFLALVVLVGVAVGGPLLIAAIAWRRKRTRAAVVHGVLAAVLAAVCLPVLAVAVRQRADEQGPSGPRSVVCQEHSGGDTRCPGG